MYNIYQLKAYANKFLKENYNMTLTVPLQLNGRMKRTCGWFKHMKYKDGRREAKCIELNKYFVENNEPTIVLDVLRHELVHYALFMQGRPNSDGHPVFENELRRLGVVSQSTIDKYDIESKPVKIQIYQCANCNTVYKRQRSLPNGGRNYCCGNCKGSLIDIGKRLVKA
jgi:SprT-like protein